jgi:hypothetical protein
VPPNNFEPSIVEKIKSVFKALADKELFTIFSTLLYIVDG